MDTESLKIANQEGKPSEGLNHYYYYYYYY
jgi:hypothetical protein